MNQGISTLAAATWATVGEAEGSTTISSSSNPSLAIVRTINPSSGRTIDPTSTNSSISNNMSRSSLRILATSANLVA